MGKKLQPKLRFSEFSSEWEDRKLSYYIENLDTGVSVNSQDFPCNSKEYGILKTSSIFKGKFYPKENKTIISRDINRAKLNPQKGNLLISRMNSPKLVGAVGLIKENYNNLFIPDRLWQTKFSKINIINSNWLNYLLNNEKYKWKIQSFATGTSNSMKNISKSVFLNTKLIVPSIQEQEKIALFLTFVDENIEILEQKLKYMQKYKKGVIQKIFSQEKRFKNKEGERFSDWDEKKLDDILKLTLREVEKPQVAYGALGVRSHAKGTFHKEVEDPKSVAMEKLFKVKKDDFIVSITFAWEHAVAICTKEDEGRLVSHRFPTYTAKDSLDINYFKYIIKQKRFKYSLEVISPGGAGRNRVLSKPALLKLKVNLPCLEEQKRIADFLSNIDEEIKILEGEIRENKEFKKGLLQQMFV